METGHQNSRSSFLHRAIDYLKQKKRQAIGATILAGSMTLAGCAPMSLEKKVMTVRDFYPGKPIVVTGEIMPAYTDDNTKSAMDAQLIVYNSIDPNTRTNIVANLHEDYRIGINDLAIKRAKQMLNSHNYIVRAYGRMIDGFSSYKPEVRYKVKDYGRITYSDMVVVDLELVAFSNKDGKLIMTVETDYDPMLSLSGNTGPLSMSLKTNVSLGSFPAWQGGFFAPSDMTFGWAFADSNKNGIPDCFDSYPCEPMNAFTETSLAPCNAYAGINWHNYLAGNLPEKSADARAARFGPRQIITADSIGIHPAFVEIFAHNRAVEANRQVVIATRDNMMRDYLYNQSVRNASQGKRFPSLERIAESKGIGKDQLIINYNSGSMSLLGTVRGGGGAELMRASFGGEPAGFLPWGSGGHGK